MRRGPHAGVFTTLDPNIRTGLIPDADAYRARFHGWLPHIGLLKLSIGGREVAGRLGGRRGCREGRGRVAGGGPGGRGAHPWWGGAERPAAATAR